MEGEQGDLSDTYGQPKKFELWLEKVKELVNLEYVGLGSV
jgi:hypothetical protein